MDWKMIVPATFFDEILKILLLGGLISCLKYLWNQKIIVGYQLVIERGREFVP